MSYVLENKNESSRLEKQAVLSAYSVSEEFGSLGIQTGQRILDAGCGTGIVARYIAECHKVQVDACDQSAQRLADAKALGVLPAHHQIRYLECGLDQIKSPPSKYDWVTCRYVFEHLSDPLVVAKEMNRVLKPGGTACVVDFDGLIFNLFPLSTRLEGMVQKIKLSRVVDLSIGRKIPEILVNAGFQDVQWRVTAHAIQGDELTAEREITRERFVFALPVIQSVLGSETLAHEFMSLYDEEVQKCGSTLFYNKFIVTGKKATGKGLNPG